MLAAASAEEKRYCRIRPDRLFLWPSVAARMHGAGFQMPIRDTRGVPLVKVNLKHWVEGGLLPSASGTPGRRGAHNSEYFGQKPVGFFMPESYLGQKNEVDAFIDNAVQNIDASFIACHSPIQSPEQTANDLPVQPFVRYRVVVG
jgi:hypothetical protein